MGDNSNKLYMSAFIISSHLFTQPNYCHKQFSTHSIFTFLDCFAFKVYYVFMTSECTFAFERFSARCTCMKIICVNTPLMCSEGIYLEKLFRIICTAEISAGLMTIVDVSREVTPSEIMFVTTVKVTPERSAIILINLISVLL